APEARTLLVQASNGDARTALNALEIAAKSTPADGAGARLVDLGAVRSVFQGRALVYDKHGEEHYNVISAFIKSMRASDPDASLYWLARMMEAGEDPLFIARRMVIFASEDIGLADPMALPLAVACFQACDVIGYPECRLNLGHATAYLARAPKSRAACEAIVRAAEDVKKTLNEPVPMPLRNGPTPLLKELGYSTRRPHGKGNENLPPSLAEKTYLDAGGPSERAPLATEPPSQPD